MLPLLDSKFLTQIRILFLTNMLSMLCYDRKRMQADAEYCFVHSCSCVCAVSDFDKMSQSQKL